jgi:hypothetical protein
MAIVFYRAVTTVQSSFGMPIKYVVVVVVVIG